jgi:hypothetical protein
MPAAATAHDSSLSKTLTWDPCVPMSVRRSASVACVVLVAAAMLATERPAWAGESWTVVRSPSPLYVSWLAGVTVLSQSDAWAVGTSERRGDNPRAHTLIEHWDGVRWTVVRSPNRGRSRVSSYLNDVVAVAADDAWAVGHSAKKY